MSKALITSPIAPLMLAPDIHSELADEVLHGMEAEVLDQISEDWCRIRTFYRYEGFARTMHLTADSRQLEAWAALPKMIVQKSYIDVLSAPRVQAYPVCSLPKGALLGTTGKSENGWIQTVTAAGEIGYTRASFLTPLPPPPKQLNQNQNELREAIVRTALEYLGAQYRWGGKTPLGIDCSGLCSMAYLLNGIVIYRDAAIRAGFPIQEIPYASVKPADLLFFPGHVAMYLGDHKIIHSTAYAGSDGVVINSFLSEAKTYRPHLEETITAAGSIFSAHI